MIPETGLFALCAGTVCAGAAALLPFMARRFERLHWRALAWQLSYSSALFITLSMVLLAWCFTLDDFTLSYVAANSNHQLPYLYKIAASWGGHEGSWLFWTMSNAWWAAAVAWRTRHVSGVIRSLSWRALSILNALSLLFGLFAVLWSNPFARQFPAAAQGRDLNPMLQDPGLVFHPPMLYLGYVGLSVAFAWAVAALLLRHHQSSSRADSHPVQVNWAREARPWLTGAWVFLTGGISLGSWWAYYELGWGGWWFWDPVENASLMPWLLATALLHSLVITSTRGLQSSWSTLLAIFAFSLSLLGTFMVRSGLLTSVHAFAADPSRGVILLSMLALITGSALSLYAINPPQDKPQRRAAGWLSRETLVMAGNALLVVATLTVLLGTYYPLLFQLLGLPPISVGAPYFNAVFVPLSFVIFALMGLVPVLRYRKNSGVTVWQALRLPLLVAVIGGLLLPWWLFEQFSLLAALAVTLALWVAMGAWQSVRRGVGSKPMLVAHLGISLAILGVTGVSCFTQDNSARMGPGDSMELADQQFLFGETLYLSGPNYTSEMARFYLLQEGSETERHLVASDGNIDQVILPERRHYTVRNMTMSEAGINWGFDQDLYITLGEKLSPTEYAVRIQVKPLVRWIWIGSLVMMAGGLAGVRLRRQRITAGLGAKSDNREEVSRAADRANGPVAADR